MSTWNKNFNVSDDEPGKMVIAIRQPHRGLRMSTFERCAIAFIVVAVILQLIDSWLAEKSFLTIIKSNGGDWIGNENGVASAVDYGERDNPSSFSSQAGSSNDNDDTRPYLIIHVGPPKTATTTIQTGLVKNAKMLARDDDFYFLGHSTGISKEDSLVDVNGDGKNVQKIYKLYPVLTFNEIDVSKDLKNLLKHGRHAIVSAEQFTSKFEEGSLKEMYKNGFLHTPNGTIESHIFNSLTDKEELHFKFRVKIIVAYRHFFDWLPSLYYQMYFTSRPTPGKPFRLPGIVGFTERYLDSLVQYDPENNSTNIFTTSATMTENHGSVFSYMKWTSYPGLYEHVDVIDLHQQPKPGHDVDDAASHDVFANFVCQNLPFASKTCHHLRNETTQAIHERSGIQVGKFLSAFDVFRIIGKTRRLPQLEGSAFWEKQKNKFGLIQEWVSQAGIEGSGPESDVFKRYKRCLDPEYSLRLKKASWNFLLQMVLLQREHLASRKDKNEGYYASLFQSSTPTNHLLLSSQFSTDDDDDSWIVPTKAAHDAAFDEHAARLIVCEAKVEEFLQNEDFLKMLLGTKHSGENNKEKQKR